MSLLVLMEDFKIVAKSLNCNNLVFIFSVRPNNNTLNPLPDDKF